MAICCGFSTSWLTIMMNSLPLVLILVMSTPSPSSPVEPLIPDVLVAEMQYPVNHLVMLPYLFAYEVYINFIFLPSIVIVWNLNNRLAIVITP